jgi:hypothetical protein
MAPKRKGRLRPYFPRWRSDHVLTHGLIHGVIKPPMLVSSAIWVKVAPWSFIRMLVKLPVGELVEVICSD